MKLFNGFYENLSLKYKPCQGNQKLYFLIIITKGRELDPLLSSLLARMASITFGSFNFFNCEKFTRARREERRSLSFQTRQAEDDVCSWVEAQLFIGRPGQSVEPTYPGIELVDNDDPS